MKAHTQKNTLCESLHPSIFFSYMKHLFNPPLKPLWLIMKVVVETFLKILPNFVTLKTSATTSSIVCCPCNDMCVCVCVKIFFSFFNFFWSIIYLFYFFHAFSQFLLSYLVFFFIFIFFPLKFHLQWYYSLRPWLETTNNYYSKKQKKYAPLIVPFSI